MTTRSSPIQEVPDLHIVPKRMRVKTLDLWNKGDMSGILLRMSSHRHFRFIDDNLFQLYRCGMLEEALVSAYITFNTGLAPFPNRLFLKSLFSFTDIDKLRSLADPLPHEGPFELYRGVVNGGNKDLMRGLSWTGTPEIASSFALDYSPFIERKDPAVFKLVVPIEKIYFYSNDREEDEFVVNVWPQARPKRLAELPPPQRLSSLTEQKLSLEKYKAKNR